MLVSPRDEEMRRTTLCGTVRDMAQEMVENSGKRHSEEVDVWANRT